MDPLTKFVAWGAGRASLMWATCVLTLLDLLVTFGLVWNRFHASSEPAVWVIAPVILVCALLIPLGVYKQVSLAWNAAQYFAIFNLVGSGIAFAKAQAGGETPDWRVWGFGALSVALLFVSYVGQPRTRRRPAEAGGTQAAAPPPQDSVGWLRDNVEAIVVAYLMALIIRCFCVEVFKIPTGSMEPTLYGDTRPEDLPPHHSGDRIMVDKAGLIFGGIQRFDVCVFKYPLDRSRNFIKRIVGLPGDDVKIEDHDLWVRPTGTGEPFRLARKPARQQAGIWIPVWPDAAPTAEACKKRWDGAPSACYAGRNLFDTQPSGGDAQFRYHDAITGSYKRKPPNERMYDVRLKFSATFGEGKGELFVRNQRGDGYGMFEVLVGAEGKVSVSREADRGGNFEPQSPVPAPAQCGAIAPGTEIEVANFDGAVRVLIGGREVLVWEYVDRLPDGLRAADAPAFPITFGSRGGAVKFAGVEVGRDIAYYASGDTCFAGKDFLTIPPERYLAIGDNVGNSKDGRLWKERHVRLKNGLTIVGDADTVEHYPASGGDMPDGRKRFRDLDGTDHFFLPSDVEDDGSGEFVSHPFVAREEFVGKALIVWFPLPRFKIIR